MQVEAIPQRLPTAQRRRCHLRLLFLRMPKVLTQLTQALPTPGWVYDRHRLPHLMCNNHNLHRLNTRMPAQLSNTTTQVRKALRVMTFTQHSLASSHRQLRRVMALANPDSQPRPDNGAVQVQFRTDTPGGEACSLIYWLIDAYGVVIIPLSVPYASPPGRSHGPMLGTDAPTLLQTDALRPTLRV
jgi:hypothetical protein